MSLTIEFCRVGDINVPAPAHSTSGSAGMDIRAALSEAVTIKRGERRLIPTGWRVAIPAGFEIQVRPRSGLALKHGVTVLNAPGTIDSDYRGEVGIVLINHGADDFRVEPLERIAQLIVATVVQTEVVVVETLDKTERGSDGYGSTGKK
ncbi:MAG: dUTP diphosphatase [Polyangiaceae bacterium]|nr:dUTP diphosphatase [Polyangiaceae bacterium]